MSRFCQWIGRFTGSTRPGVRSRTLPDCAEEVVRRAEEIVQRGTPASAVTTGFRDLDRKLGGMPSGELILLAGRPDMGKSILARTVAVNAAKAYQRTQGAEGASVIMFCLETSAEQATLRLMASEASVRATSIWVGDLDQGDITRLKEVQRELNSLQLCFVETSSATVRMVSKHARLLKQSANRGLVIVDCLERLRSKDARATRDRAQEAMEIVAGLSDVARQFDLPILVIADLGDTLESRTDKRPRLSDLREFGEVEPYLDVVLFLYRRVYYLERSEPERIRDESPEDFNERHQNWRRDAMYFHDIAECGIAKQLHGPLGHVVLGFGGVPAKFFDLDDAERHPLRLRFRRPGHQCMSGQAP